MSLTDTLLRSAEHRWYVPLWGAPLGIVVVSADMFLSAISGTATRTAHSMIEQQAADLRDYDTDSVLDVLPTRPGGRHPVRAERHGEDAPRP